MSFKNRPKGGIIKPPVETLTERVFKLEQKVEKLENEIKEKARRRHILR